MSELFATACRNEFYTDTLRSSYHYVVYIMHKYTILIIKYTHNIHCTQIPKKLPSVYLRYMHAHCTVHSAYSHYKGLVGEMRDVLFKRYYTGIMLTQTDLYNITSLYPQNLRNIIKKVAKISIIQILMSVKTTAFFYFLQLFRYPTNFHVYANSR